MFDLNISEGTFRLRRNGAHDPNRWEPGPDNRRDDGFRSCARPAAGDLIAWRYAAWRVHQIRPYQTVDLTAEQLKKLDKLVETVDPERREQARAQAWPFHIILRHERGPLIIEPGWEKAFKRLRDGSNTHEISFTSWPTKWTWVRLPEPYKVCSCHGHPWPCQDIDRQAVADVQMKQFKKLELSHTAGVCAYCREPISTRQKTVTFPEPSRLLPGAPGPTFHAGRVNCWAAAEEYERRYRLADDPNIVRIASCPGIMFIHEARSCPPEKRVECTAGTGCTGLHGPAGHQREAPCWHRVHLVDNEGGYARPSFDCGYRQPGVRECVGADMSSGGTSISPTAADIRWEQRIRAEETARKPPTSTD